MSFLIHSLLSLVSASCKLKIRDIETWISMDCGWIILIIKCQEIRKCTILYRERSGFSNWSLSSWRRGGRTIIRLDLLSLMSCLATMRFASEAHHADLFTYILIPRGATQTDVYTPHHHRFFALPILHLQFHKNRKCHPNPNGCQ
jgi:hypothetical protein